MREKIRKLLGITPWATSVMRNYHFEIPEDIRSKRLLNNQEETAIDLLGELKNEIYKGNLKGSGIESEIIKVDGVLQYGNKLVYSFVVDTSDVKQE